MDLGPVDIEPAFSNAFLLRDRREELRRDATAILNTWADGTLMVMTHGANIQALSGVSPTSAEIVVVDPLTSRSQVDPRAELRTGCRIGVSSHSISSDLTRSTRLTKCGLRVIKFGCARRSPPGSVKRSPVHQLDRASSTATR